eukprot:NODE_29036_length_458_cov_3.157100.p2 GENE.NODE_29036_length_458_cov_3.157100~~NODE_29036_length_458_cov_3.157100.p2  ORF type:complete len:54 (+),score=3.95 NODE_29036_length_458_cov_3.157100:223-384(+)
MGCSAKVRSRAFLRSASFYVMPICTSHVKHGASDSSPPSVVSQLAPVDGSEAG